MNEKSSEHKSDKCPKCGAPRAVDTCPKCGVAYDKYDPQAELLKVPASVRSLWANVEQNWTDTAAHAVFVEQGVRQDAAGYVAACYREKGDDPIAIEQLEKLTGRLLDTLAQQTAVDPPNPKRLKPVLYMLLFVIIAILVFMIIAQSMR